MIAVRCFKLRTGKQKEEDLLHWGQQSSSWSSSRIGISYSNFVHYFYVFVKHEHLYLANMKEAEIIERALNKLEALTGITVLYVAKKDHQKYGDGIIRIQPAIEFIAEAKNEIRQTHLPDLISQANKMKGQFILISRYIPMPVKSKLKSEGLNYLETSGNCYIRYKSLFIYINDQKVTPEREVDKSKLWNTAGLRFVFAILQKPELLNQSYRELTKSANVALGTVGRLLEDLQKENFLKTGTRNGEKFLFIERRDELINKWTTIYNTILRPKLLIGNFRVTGKTLSEDTPLPAGLLWGGEMAGAKLTKYLKPEKLALYISIPKAEAMKYLKIVPDASGNIELLNIFWNTELTADTEFNENQIAPPLIVFADLLSSHDSRNYETAERIKESL